MEGQYEFERVGTASLESAARGNINGGAYPLRGLSKSG